MIYENKNLRNFHYPVLNLKMLSMNQHKDDLLLFVIRCQCRVIHPGWFHGRKKKVFLFFFNNNNKKLKKI